MRGPQNRDILDQKPSTTSNATETSATERLYASWLTDWLASSTGASRRAPAMRDGNGRSSERWRLQVVQVAQVPSRDVRRFQTPGGRSSTKWTIMVCGLGLPAASRITSALRDQLRA
jgi:hypothetical protein